MQKERLERVVQVLAGPGVRQYRLCPDGGLSVVDARLRKLRFDADEVAELLAARTCRRKGAKND